MSRHETHRADAESFETIRAALARSARGRAFLAELARRARAQDTRQLLDAIARLERRIAGGTEPDGLERWRRGRAEVAAAVARTRQDIVALIADAEAPIDPGSADAKIVDAAEQIQETAWTMREGGLDPALCDALDRHASEISAACAARDASAERTARVIGALRRLEAELGLASEAWAGAEPEADGRIIA